MSNLYASKYKLLSAIQWNGAPGGFEDFDKAHKDFEYWIQLCMKDTVKVQYQSCRAGESASVTIGGDYYTLYPGDYFSYDGVRFKTWSKAEFEERFEVLL